MKSETLALDDKGTRWGMRVVTFNTVNILPKIKR